ncbi:MAG: hypothetical protein HOQ05_04120 [Corynebacteriales bacterium]|nr:hypothetical protein [Mycobacteriales bacterium]
MSRNPVLVAILAVALCVPGMRSAHADPAPPSLGDAEAQVIRLEQEMVTAAEDYHEAKVLLDESQARLDELMPKYSTVEEQYAERQRGVDELASAAYTTGGVDAMAMLLSTGSPQTALDQLTLLQMLHAHRHDQLAELSDTRGQMREAKDEIDAQVGTRAEQERVLREKQTRINEDLTKWGKLRDKLSGRPKGAKIVSYDGQGQGLSAVVLRFAFDQQGKPYQFAAAGPSAYDCSGLTAAAWGRAGVQMAHSARQQYASFPHVSPNDLQPGDLVFYGEPIYHVALYAGDGQVVHAPQPGQNVQVVPVSAPGRVSGAARPG